ncbi:dehydrogenase [Clostridium novyi A str. 4570]|uniref:Dehydrogenase n=1 Tax=Clostridium novyi A str. 4570 TaxID=1444290 RepID=A0AA88ZMH3_CLONO|nr:FAD-dependent oxidoreductase [Clostridium novyi]KGN00870.1 dehydrogenase [Clostridium novyi A str. 4570]
MDYDVLILGGGLIGCAVAYELSKYSLNIALIEKDYDIADDVALVNSSIIFDGIQTKDNIMSKLEYMGMNMIKDLAKKFDVPYKSVGSLIIAKDEKEEKEISEIYNKAIENGIPNIHMLEKDEIKKLEPNLNINATKAVYSKNTGVICPYDLAIAYGEIAFDNGVSFKLEEIVEDIKPTNKGFKVVTNKNKFTCRMVINTTPEDYKFDEFSEKKCKHKGYLKYFLIEGTPDSKLNNIIFTRRAGSDEIIHTYPTVQGNYIVSVNTENNITYSECYNIVSKLIKNIKPVDVNTFYNSHFYNDLIMIDDSLVDKGYIKISGKNYAEVTMTASISRIICETVENNLKCKLKKDFNDKVRETYKFKDMTNEERNNLIKVDKNYGKIICACNMVTEGEIVDAIRRPLGARTVEGIKRRTGAGAGTCNGAHCLNKIVSILARETNKSMTDIVKDSKNSKILLNRIKEFDDM